MKKLVVIALSTIAVLTLISAPIAAAQGWENIPTPFTNGQVNYRVAWVGPMEKAINGDLYAAVGLYGPKEVIIYKSTNFGRNWTQGGGQPFDAETGVAAWEGVIFDIETSSTNANVVYVTDGYDIYKSINGGSTWVVLDNLFDEALDVEPEGLIVSIAVGTFGGTYYLFAATSTFGGGGGGAYVLQESIFVSQWVDLEVASEREGELGQIDVLAIDTLPDFTTNQGVVAVISSYATEETLVTSRFMAGEWGQNAVDCVLQYNDEGDMEDVDDVLLDAVLWFPTDFSSDAEGGNWVLFVGINPQNETEQGDVYQCFSGAPDDDPMVAYDLDVRGQDSGVHVSDMDGVGGWVSADILISGYTENEAVPHTWATQDGGLTWFQDAKRPTGGLSPLYPRALSSLRVSPNFATNGLALVGTHGMDCGLSISNLPTDICATGFTWNTIFFINACSNQEAAERFSNYATEMAFAQKALVEGRYESAVVHMKNALQCTRN